MLTLGHICHLCIFYLFFLVTEKHASKRRRRTQFYLSSRKYVSPVKLPFFSKNTVDCLPKLDPQFDYSTSDVNLSISKDSVERLELLSSQDTHCLSVGTCIIKRETVDRPGRVERCRFTQFGIAAKSSLIFTLPGEVPIEPVGASACLN